MLKQVQYDKMVWFWSICHPEPGPESDTLHGEMRMGNVLCDYSCFKMLDFSSAF